MIKKIKRKVLMDVTNAEYKRIVNLRKLGYTPKQVKRIVFNK